MNNVNFYFLCGFAYVTPFKTKKTLDDVLVIEEVGLIGGFIRIEIITPFNYE